MFKCISFYFLNLFKSIIQIYNKICNYQCFVKKNTMRALYFNIYTQNMKKNPLNTVYIAFGRIKISLKNPLQSQKTLLDFLHGANALI
jgi:hypothetical protein